MPTRLIREGINDSEAVNALDFAAEVFYRRLLNLVDDFGRFDARPAVLRARLYALKLTTVSDADVSTWLADCVRVGLVTVYQHEGKAFLAVSRFNQQIRSKSSKWPPPPIASCVAPATHMPSICCADAQHMRTKTETKTETETNLSSSSAMRDEDAKTTSKTKTTKPHPLDEEAFAKFWQTYPRKVGKADAKKAFAKVAPSVELLATILEALDRQKHSHDWTKDGGQFIPHPSTWLNGHRWEDEGTTLPKPPPIQPSPAILLARSGEHAEPMKLPSRQDNAR